MVEVVADDKVHSNMIASRERSGLFASIE